MKKKKISPDSESFSKKIKDGPKMDYQNPSLAFPKPGKRKKGTKNGRYPEH